MKICFKCEYCSVFGIWYRVVWYNAENVSEQPEASNLYTEDWGSRLFWNAAEVYHTALQNACGIAASGTRTLAQFHLYTQLLCAVTYLLGGASFGEANSCSANQEFPSHWFITLSKNTNVPYPQPDWVSLQPPKLHFNIIFPSLPEFQSFRFPYQNVELTSLAALT